MEAKFSALVVEDEALIRTLAVRALSKVGFDCDSARDGIEAAGMLKQSQYDLVVTDLRMPRENGLTLATKLLARRKRPRVVVLTGVIEPSVVDDLIARGVDKIVVKPVDYKQLADKLLQLVQNRADTGTQYSRAAARATWRDWLSSRFAGATREESFPVLERFQAQGALSLQQLRDQAIVSLALQGLTPAELAVLKIEDLQVFCGSDSLSVVRNGGIRFTIRLNCQTGQCIRDYLQCCGHYDDPEAYLLQPMPDEPIDSSGAISPATVENILTQHVTSLK